MKIGIITFWQTKDNYGQMLQNLALQQYLLSLGHSPYLIRYAHSQAKQSQIEDVVLNFCVELNILISREINLCCLKNKLMMRIDVLNNLNLKI